MIFGIEKEKDARYYALLVNAALVSVMELAPVLIGTFILTSFIYIFKKNNANEWWNWRKAVMAGVPFVLAIIGLINTSDFNQGWADVSRLLPYCVYPLFLLGIAPELKAKWHRSFTWMLILGVTANLNFYLIRASLRFFETGNTRHFFYINLVQETNTLSFFVLIALLLALLKFSCGVNPRRKVIFISLLSLNLVIGLLLMQSRMIILIYLVLSVFFALFNWRNLTGKAFLAITLVTGLLLFSPALNGRFQSMTPQKVAVNNSTKMEIQVAQIDTITCMGSATLRMNAMKTALVIIKENPVVGVGTGDWRNEMFVHYQKAGMECNAKEKTAPHNQFLRTAVKHGIIGLIVFLLTLAFLFFPAWKTRDYERMAVALSVGMSCVAYDCVDGGASAPFIALIFGWFMLRRK